MADSLTVNAPSAAIYGGGDSWGGSPGVVNGWAFVPLVGAG
jgi:hypothetical protein